MLDTLALLRVGPDGWGDEILSGTWLTLRLALATLPVGIVAGFLLALMRNNRSRLVSAPADAFATVFRGLPELLTLFLVYYGGPALVQSLVRLVEPDYRAEFSPFLAGLAALALVFAAFSSEVFLGALRAISRGQIEGARALGLSRWLTLRLVVLPQLWRLALPGLSNLWLALLKDTSLVSVIALNDLMRQTNVAVGATKQPFFFYLVACLIYLAMSAVSTVLTDFLERRANRGFERARA